MVCPGEANDSALHIKTLYIWVLFGLKEMVFFFRIIKPLFLGFVYYIVLLHIIREVTH